MLYLLLIVEPRGQRSERTAAQGHDVYKRMLRFADDLKARGVLRAVESLKSDAGGARVARHEGKCSIIDGPFTEAKELIGGFFLVDCKTRAEAVAIAQECPAAEWATIEVRETGPCYE